jgi:hypothetical protein
MACELTEVTVPLGQPRVIVQSVYSRGAPYQFVVVEASRTGADTGSSIEPEAIPPEGPALPSVGALVTLGYSTGSPCAARVDTLPPYLYPGTDGVYRGVGLCVADPGDTVFLRVVTADGRVVTGSTVVAGASRVVAAVAADTAVDELDSLFLDRDRDTLRVGLEAISGRAMQVEARRVGEPPGEGLVLYLISDSLGIAVPGDLVNPFSGDDGEPIFLAGQDYWIGVAVTDSNYYDYVRSRSDPFTGRGFINRLQGGIGVFGSVEVHRFLIRVVE